MEHVEFRNPSFFNTRKELLSRAQFQIIDLNTNLPLNFSERSPTYIQAIIQTSVLKMKKSFNIFLDSSCPKSKALYPKNNSMEFTIELPERLSFNRNWQVTLKSLFIPNMILHLNDCYVKYFHHMLHIFFVFQKYDGSGKKYKVKFNRRVTQVAFYEPYLFFYVS